MYDKNSTKLVEEKDSSTMSEIVWYHKKAEIEKKKRNKEEMGEKKQIARCLS